MKHIVRPHIERPPEGVYLATSDEVRERLDAVACRPVTVAAVVEKRPRTAAIDRGRIR